MWTLKYLGLGIIEDWLLDTMPVSSHIPYEYTQWRAQRWTNQVIFNLSRMGLHTNNGADILDFAYLESNA
jgi:hypothetical protein